MLTYTCLPFSDLTTDQLYQILQLRQQVFVVEQDCAYQDCDDKDQMSYHILGNDADGRLQAYTRLVPPGISYGGYASIGRVITSQQVRGKKYGVSLMQYSIDQTLDLWPDLSIKISAQTYIVKFYKSLGFVEVGESYLEDNLPHIAMIRK